MRAFVRQPLLHFMLIGIALWLSSVYLQDRASRQIDAPTEQEIATLVADWSSRHGRMADAQVQAALVREEIERRLVFAEALRLGLHRHDPVVLARLYQDAVFLGIEAPEDEMINMALELQLHRGDDLIRRRLLERMRSLIVSNRPPATEAELREVFAAHQARWTQPARISFEHIYLRPADSSTQAWAKAKDRALQLLKTAPDARAGDPFLHGHRFEHMSARQLKDTFGGQMPALLEQDSTAAWIGPVASHYGWHLISIQTREPARPAEFEQVRADVLALWTAQSKRQHFAKYVQGLRARYRVNS
ncbi:MAG: peptidyl-prolyl cis-trans isomerase [Oceanococcus sp.]|nr:MAG: peptidyl-prolyl cis-trans isomerase [Oceanococcus sp.]